MKNLVLSSIFLLFGCHSKSQENKVDKDIKIKPEAPKLEVGQQFAVLASGCFWCVEHIYEDIPGVISVTSGYSGGHKINPTYREVGSETTGHAEAVLIIYDEKKLTFKDIIEVFFYSHDPTTLNQQGPDRGESYRSIAFYNNELEKKIITEMIKKLTDENVFEDKIITEIKPFEKFYPAEKYHQDYVKLNPFQDYVQGVSIPRCKAFKQKYKGRLKLND